MLIGWRRVGRGTADRCAQQRQLGDEFGQQAIEAAFGSAVGGAHGIGFAVGPDDEVDGTFAKMEAVAGQQGRLMLGWRRHAP
jgi:hypothetical protein